MDSEFSAAPPDACNGQAQAHDLAGFPESIFLGVPIQTIPDTGKAANPITYIRSAKKLPVFSIAAGHSGCLVPYQQSEILHSALGAAGARSSFTLIPGARHADPVLASSRTPVALAVLAECSESNNGCPVKAARGSGSPVCR